MIQVLPSLYFQANFLTVRPYAANDMALESLKKCETFWYVLLLPVLYDFKLVSKMEKKRIFAVLSMYFIGMAQIIYRWKATENVKLFHVDCFLLFLAIFK